MGFTEGYDRFNELRTGNSKNKTNLNLNSNENGIAGLETDIPLDSIQSIIFNSLEKAEKKQDSITTLKLPDSTKTNNGFHFNVLGEEVEIVKLMSFKKKNPTLSINKALDSLKIKKTFKNRFWYSRAEAINSIMSNKDEGSRFSQEMISYSSLALFILLPLFTLFLKLIYVRKKYTYVEHLIFVFHTQTVFFLLFSIFYIINFFKNAENIIGIFLLLFMIYLYLAMKKFYGQGYLKTLIKYALANTFFMMIALLGTMLVSLITFAFY